jgi:hypothetical protein
MVVVSGELAKGRLGFLGTGTNFPQGMSDQQNEILVVIAEGVGVGNPPPRERGVARDRSQKEIVLIARGVWSPQIQVIPNPRQWPW